jgi:predicted RND superfamily exporter protein
VGKPILVTSIVIGLGFVIFLFSDFQYTRSMGILVSFTLVSAVFADLLLLPVLLSLFHPAKDRGGARNATTGTTRW